MNLPPKHILSKSTFLYGCQCPLRLWLHKYQPALKDPVDEEQQQVFQQGTDLGMLARDLFSGGVDASPPDYFQFALSVKKTAEYIAAGKTIIYEAAFQYNGLLCAIDILVKQPDGWYAYEVKGSTKVKEIFIQDAAFQYYVITGAGLDLQQMSLIYLNNQYIRKGSLQLEQLFSTTPITSEVRQLSEVIQQKTNELLQVVANKTQAPSIVAGEQCTRPYTCDFFTHCNGIQETSIQILRDPIIQKENIREWLGVIQYPVFYMDFETWMDAIPPVDGCWPYRQVCFQYSVQVEQYPGATPQEFTYLAERKTTHILDFIESLLQVLGNAGSIVVYNASFERTRLLEFIKDDPSLEESINAIVSRMIDLMDVFRKRFYYLPAMGDSYSIKWVLPAIFPDMKYEDLVIANGMDAAAAFQQLSAETDPTKITAIQSALLTYCALDTQALFNITQHLQKLVND
ncbi:MAG: DUF2779 domain-containing protein [Chitinophagia bacterium]|jgi:hypothetical protein